nr:ribonuclease H-like domain, reverse transcriptase, RNA-dependent DNA polymerase [Tanacetum cinerariifolium]
MPALEDITYSDDEEDVGAEADFSNLETSIPVSPITTTRVYKDHHQKQDGIFINQDKYVAKILRKFGLTDRKSASTPINTEKPLLKDPGGEDMDVHTYSDYAGSSLDRKSTTKGCQFLGCRLISWQSKKQIVGDTSSTEAEIIEEEVFVYQPLGFEDSDYLDKVYKLVKALYGLHQAPRAWYETLANYLLEIGFQRGKIDDTLFIKKQKGDILLVQVYVDDIIFGFTNKDLCKAFENLMKDKFQISSMGELTFFLGLQVKQKQDGIFINQDKYVAKILRKFGLTDGKSASTPINTEKPLLKDPGGEDMDVHTYSDYAGSSLDRKSTTKGCQFLGCRLISWQSKKQIVGDTSSTEAEYVAAASCYAQVLWIQN